jgi:hypothetical protein
MKKFTSHIILLFVLPLICSCTKVIDLKLGNNTGKLVIEANVTNATGPQIIKLSQNVPVTSTNTYPPVTGATVTVTDQAGNAYVFTESTPGTYTTSTLTGIPGSSYTMTVTSGSKTYTATSAMPVPIALDSLTSKNDEFNTSKHKKNITVHYEDPAGAVNQYRFVMFVNDVQVKTIYAFNDDFNDGRTVSIDLRTDNNSDPDFGIYAGDTVTVEMQCIDKPIYTYWFTMMQQGDNGPGGGVTPADPPSNITPTVLGYFSTHTTQRKTIVVK